MSEKILEYEKTLIDTLRQEAKDVKDCYTKFSFQAIAFSSTILGITARFQPDHPLIALASFASIIILITVARIGIYKYGSANRMYGYELHLFRTRNLPDSIGNGWKSQMREIGWEEAMRAWRIVQVSVFGKLYRTRKLFPKRLKKEYRDLDEAYKWFDLEDLVEPEAEYHPGSYLGTINSILFSLALLSVIPILFMAIQLGGINIFALDLWDFLPALALIIVLQFWARERARRKILESELLSIHSCAIVWQAVIVAHFRALKNSSRFQYYTKNLVIQANDLLDNVFDIHAWVYDEMDNDE